MDEYLRNCGVRKKDWEIVRKDQTGLPTSFGAIRYNRTKIAVFSHDKNVEPVGACVGQRGQRVQVIVDELRGEKIDIIQWSDDPELFVGSALSPAKVIEVNADKETNSARVIVEDSQLSLAIGKEGQNARLAAKLTGWKIDIKSQSQVTDI
jgi:N utilization substance protein A